MRKQTVFTILGVVAIVVVAGYIWAGLPSVASVNPDETTTTIRGNAPISITFSRKMNKESVTKNMVISPNIALNATWEGRTVIFTPDEPFPPGEIVELTINTGARSTWGVPLLKKISIQFSVAAPQIVYLWNVNEPADLYIMEPDTGKDERLTFVTNGVRDYDVAKDGSHIYYFVREDKGSVLYALNLETKAISAVLTCSDGFCISPQISPNEKWLAYEWTATTGTEIMGITRVRLLSLERNQISVPGEQTGETYLPAWSPDNKLLFYDLYRDVYALIEPTDGELATFSNETGSPVTWSPDGRSFIATEIYNEPSNTYSSKLIRYNTVSSNQIVLTKEEGVEDTEPIYSPDGLFVAFIRRTFTSDSFTLGGQIWIMQNDGSHARPLTTDREYAHSGISWKSDGTHIVYLRHNQTQFTDEPELWMIDINSGVKTRLVIGGYFPTWIP